MNSTIKLLAVAALLVACGDNKSAPADAKHADAAPGDAMCSNCPVAPTLGTQIDRMGRAAINTALNHMVSGTAAQVDAAKVAYNQAADPTTWLTFVPEFMKNLGVIDSLDSYFCGNGVCETGETGGTTNTAPECMADCGASTTMVGTGDGCGNQVLYNGMPTGGGTPAMTSYQTLGGILADDQLYLDTSKGLCAFYLAVEFGVATAGTNSTCGGRAPQYDVIDFTLSLGAIGLKGFSADGLFTPRFGDTVAAHSDYLASFPYLGDPH